MKLTIRDSEGDSLSQTYCTTWSTMVAPRNKKQAKKDSVQSDDNTCLCCPKKVLRAQAPEQTVVGKSLVSSRTRGGKELTPSINPQRLTPISFLSEKCIVLDPATSALVSNHLPACESMDAIFNTYDLSVTVENQVKPEKAQQLPSHRGTKDKCVDSLPTCKMQRAVKKSSARIVASRNGLKKLELLHDWDIDNASSTTKVLACEKDDETSDGGGRMITPTRKPRSVKRKSHSRSPKTDERKQRLDDEGLGISAARRPSRTGNKRRKRETVSVVSNNPDHSLHLFHEETITIGNTNSCNNESFLSFSASISPLLSLSPKKSPASTENPRPMRHWHRAILINATPIGYQPPEATELEPEMSHAALSPCTIKEHSISRVGVRCSQEQISWSPDSHFYPNSPKMKTTKALPWLVLSPRALAQTVAASNPAGGPPQLLSPMTKCVREDCDNHSCYGSSTPEKDASFYDSVVPSSSIPTGVWCSPRSRKALLGRIQSTPKQNTLELDWTPPRLNAGFHSDKDDGRHRESVGFRQRFRPPACNDNPSPLFEDEDILGSIYLEGLQTGVDSVPGSYHGNSGDLDEGRCSSLLSPPCGSPCSPSQAKEVDLCHSAMHGFSPSNLFGLPDNYSLARPTQTLSPICAAARRSVGDFLTSPTLSLSQSLSHCTLPAVDFLAEECWFANGNHKKKKSPSPHGNGSPSSSSG